jgi:uncharacterized protein (DUF362 family)
MSSVLVLDAEYPITRGTVETIFSHFEPPVTKTLIKPNILGGFEPDRHVTTHPSLVQALVEYFEKGKMCILLLLCGSLRESGYGGTLTGQRPI